MYKLQNPKRFLFSKVRQVGTNQLLYFTCVEPEARLLGRMMGGGGTGDRNGWLTVEGADLGEDTQQY